MHRGERGLFRDITIILLCFLLFGCTSVPIKDRSARPGADADVALREPTPNETIVRRDHTLQPHSDSEASETWQDARLLVTIRNKLRRAKKKLENESSRDLWARIGNGLDLAAVDHPLIERKIKWYQQNQSHLDRVADRAAPFLHLVVEEIERQDMPLDLALLPVVESAYEPFAYSRRHAAGLWQFIPSTGRRFGLEQNEWYDGRRDVLASTQAALDYLGMLHEQFDGDWLLALAAYNCGEAHVARAIERNRNTGRAADFWSLNLPRETRHYVPSLLALSAIARRPEAYEVNLKPIPNKPVLAQVKSNKRFDLRQAAKLAGISSEKLKTYNPGFKNWATGPRGPHAILVPRSKAHGLADKLAGLPSPRIAYGEGLPARHSHHKVRKGDTLARIAQRYRTSVAVLKKINGLSRDIIPVGLALRLPHSKASTDTRVAGLAKKQFHVVQKGETLWHIAERYDTSVEEICAWNKWSPARPLSLYQKLVVLASSRSGKGPLFFKTAVRLAHQQLHYRVKRGDSLWSIGQRFGVSPAELREWNRLSKRDQIRPGQNLKIYIAASV